MKGSLSSRIKTCIFYYTNDNDTNDKASLIVEIVFTVALSTSKANLVAMLLNISRETIVIPFIATRTRIIKILAALSNIGIM